MEETKTVETTQNEMPQVKSMTRAQVREMRNLGLDPAVNPEITGAKMAEMVDFMADKIYAGHNFDNVDYDKLVKLAMDTHQKTYGKTSEIKN